MLLKCVIVRSRLWPSLSLADDEGYGSGHDSALGRDWLLNIRVLPTLSQFLLYPGNSPLLLLLLFIIFFILFFFFF